MGTSAIIDGYIFIFRVILIGHYVFIEEKCMKKMSRALFTGALIFALFSGCAPKEASQSAGGSGKTKIAVWHSFVGSDQRAEFMAARLEEFKALHPELEIEEQKFPRDQYQTRLKTLAAAGTLPVAYQEPL
jgi:raffinose/stachyose/melibiose transport system substrate-binding protein